jgi:mRNA-degrading endonuclease RelE of RelBE toxin-antitoxin system
MKPPVEVVPSPWFSKRIKTLRKRYPHIAQDTRPLIEQLQRGETPGEQIQAKDYTVYKARVSNRDAQRGKSGGYRVVYYIQTRIRITLLTIYSKTDQNDIRLEDIEAIIADLPDDE